MPLPQVPDGPEKPPTYAGEPGAPATASPQAELLAELWAKARQERAYYYENIRSLTHSESTGALLALESTQSAVTAVLHHLYGMPKTDAQVRVQTALGEELQDAQGLL